MAINLDKVSVTSLTGAYQNYDTTTGGLVITGTIAPLDTATFSTTIPFTREQTIADVYAKAGNGDKTLLSAIQSIPTGSIYTFAGDETCTFYVSYGASSITIEAIIFSVSGVTLTTQTITLTVVKYDAPFSAI